MLEQLKRDVLRANRELVTNGLVIFTWGNVSAIDRASGLIVIKPSGMDYDVMTEEDMVVVNLDGEVVEGNRKPSVDLYTHIELYKSFDKIGAVVHTHSTFATAYAQAGKPIEPYGTTHADYFYGAIPCARALTKKEVDGEYERNTGKVIVKTFAKLDYNAIPAALVDKHGVFAWGVNAHKAVYNATVVEQCAKMAYLSRGINPDLSPVSQYLLDRHYLRKHGKNATYGQGEDK
ncbi:MAG: L-ribulose-5-phosphate 4-epimerase [Clostridiales bacterium]|nr:L-ribulose-5-phosphate 4-epimerase [Clostridiales bacterium]